MQSVARLQDISVEMQLLCSIFVLFISGKASDSEALRGSGQPKSGDWVECRSLTAWVPAKYVEMKDGMPICELNGVRRPFQDVRTPKIEPQKLAAAKQAKKYDKHAVPEPHGHTSQVNPLKPNTDRKWYIEGRWKKGEAYKHQDGEITDDPAFHSAERMPPIESESRDMLMSRTYAFSLGMTMIVILFFMVCFGCWYISQKPDSARDSPTSS